MNSKNIFLSFATLVMLLFTACNGGAQNTKQQEATTSSAAMEVIQFHSENRCMTCNKIEELTRETLKDFSDIPFSTVNVDDEKNEQKAAEFEAFGTSLFLYNPKTGKKENLTEFAFMNAGNKEKFTQELKKKIASFQKL